MNAAIRAIPFRAIADYGWQVYGIMPGKHGLMNQLVDAEGFAGNIFTEHVLRLGGIGHDVGGLIQERMETDTCVSVLGHYSVV